MTSFFSNEHTRANFTIEERKDRSSDEWSIFPYKGRHDLSRQF